MGFFDSIVSILTGGASDLIQGKPMGSGSVGFINSIFPEDTFVGQMLPSMLLPAESAYKDISKIWNQGGSAIDVFSNTFERLADPTNSVNYSLGRFGQKLPESVRNAAPAIGTTIGTIAYPVAGTALGYGIGAHLRGDTSTQALTGAGTAATAAWAGGELANQLGSTAGKISGNLASTALKTGGSVLQGMLASHPAEMRQAMDNLKDYEKTAMFNGTYGDGLISSPDFTPVTSSAKTEEYNTEKTPVPSLTSGVNDKEEKLAKVLTDPYKSYKLDEYLLYKADPEKLQEIIERYT